MTLCSWLDSNVQTNDIYLFIQLQITLLGNVGLAVLIKWGGGGGGEGSLSLGSRHTDNSRSPAPDIAVPQQALCYLSRSNRGLKNRRLFLQHSLFLALVNPGNHKQQNTQPSKRIVPWINIAFLGISGLLIHYHLAQSGLVAMGSIIAKFTRVKISLWCVIIWVWFNCVRCCKGTLFSLQQLLVYNNY